MLALLYNWFTALSKYDATVAPSEVCMTSDIFFGQVQCLDAVFNGPAQSCFVPRVDTGARAVITAFLFVFNEAFMCA